jgi:hypothetical protein
MFQRVGGKISHTGGDFVRASISLKQAQKSSKAQLCFKSVPTLSLFQFHSWSEFEKPTSSPFLSEDILNVKGCTVIA